MFAHKSNLFAALSAAASDDELLRLRCDSQSMAYYGDISRFLASRLLGYETLSLLDVGPRTGAGLALLRLLHHPASFARLKFDPVRGIDIDPAFEIIATQELPDIQAMTGHTGQIADKQFDVVVCSHTVEQVPDLDAFVAELVRIARRCVVISAPFEEREPRLDGHLQYIDATRLRALGFADFETYDSFHFHSAPCCLAYRPVTS